MNNEILNSAMAQEKRAKLEERKEEITKELETRKAEFEESNEVEKREALINDCENLKSEAKSIDDELTNLKELEENLKEQENRMSMETILNNVEVKANAVSEDVRSSQEYKQLYADNIRGIVADKEIKEYVRSANLSTGTANIPVPTIMQGYVETAWASYGKFSNIVKSTYVAGLLSIPVEQSADDAVWHDENSSAPAQENITLGQITLQPKTIKKWIALTDELMAMGADEFLKYVADELVYRVVKALDEAIISRTDADGKGVIGVAGNANTAKVTEALGFNSINDAVANLISFDNLVVAMHPETFFKNVMGLKDTTGRPIYSVVADNAGKPQYFVGGYRVEFTQALKSYDKASAGDVYAVVGNFADGYRLNYPAGKEVSTLIDPYTLATEDTVRMIGRLLVAGNVCKLGHFAELVKE